MTRDERQSVAKEAAIKLLKSRNSAALMLGTGFGKSKVTLDVLLYFNPNRITWLTNSTDLRDNTTPAEFVKWDCEHLLERTTFMCYQTAYKLKDQDLGFIIADEADFSLTEEYSKVYTENNYDKLLLVSATVRENQEEMLRSLADIAYTYTTQEAQDDNVLNKTKFIFVKYTLSSVKDIEVKAGGKTWMSSEQEQYAYTEQNYTATLIKFLSIKQEVDLYYSSGGTIRPSRPIDALMRDKKAMSAKLKWINAKRFDMLSSLGSSRAVTKKLLFKIYADNLNKVVVFSNRVEQIEKICKFTYHSKNKGTKKEPNLGLEKFNSGELRVLGVCQVLNRGANMVGLNHGILESYDGSGVKGQQRVGRFCRLLADEEATIYVLQPYYLKKYKIRREDNTVGYEWREAPTRAVAWSEAMLADFRLDDSNSSYINENEI